MNPTVARIIGGAGTGKTSRLLDLMARTIEAGELDPTHLGFVSFTRAARAEASSRAAERFGCRQDELERDGWFRTLHSVCHRCLAIGDELLTGKSADRKWLEESIEEPISGSGSQGDEGFASVAFEAAGDAETALGLWDAARNRLEPFESAWQRAEQVNDRTPPLAYCRQVVERYEQAKRLKGRCDFVDLLGRFAGWRFGFDEHSQCRPQGDVPYVPTWFLDEQQDTSALLDSVCRRLIEPSRWVYVVGDPYQSIYGWAGADPRHFMGWEVAKQEVMPISFRCPERILRLGERVLRECSDYWDRGIAPSEAGGRIEEAPLGFEAFEEISPSESWLLLARSNYHAKRLASFLESRGVPWLPTRGSNSWNAPVTNAGLLALHYLEQGAPIDGHRWKLVLKLLPSKAAGQSFLVRGTKTRWEKGAEGSPEDDDRFPIFARDISNFGGTEALALTLQDRSWRRLIEGAERFCSAVDTWGEAAVMSPGIRVSTIHAAKGGEADNVLLLASTSSAVARSMETKEGADEERRVNYVAVTRARKRLIVVRERAQFEMELPAA